MEKYIQTIQIQENRFEQIVKGRTNFLKSPKQRITVSYVETRLEGLEKTWQAFKVGHEQLTGHISNASKKDLSYFTEDTFSQCEEAYIDYKSDLKCSLNELTPKSVQSVQQTTSTTQKTEITLPTIKLPTFSGNYTDWPSFHDLFHSLIHVNTNLDAVQKLHYLKTSVSGEAEQLLRTVTVTHDNYEQAWSALKNRYSNKKYLANCILKKLFNLKHLTSESATHIKQLIDATAECLSSLKNLGMQVESWDAIIVYMTVRRLDTESHRLWEQHTSSDTELPTFTSLKNFLETRFRSLEMLEPSTKTAKTRSFHTASDTYTNSYTITCSYCNQKHYIYQCKQFAKLNYKDKAEHVYKYNLCFNCLIPNHSANKCYRNTSCRICQKKHHSLLHPERKESIEEEKQTDENKIMTHFVKQPGQIILATALVGVTSGHGIIHTYRALIDQGSQASFVTEDLVQTLGLRRVRVHGVVAGCGGKTLHTKSMVEVQLQSRTNTNFTIQIKAYVLGKITNNLPTKQIELSSWHALENITLADPGFNVPNKIHLLLGAEVYSQIINIGLLKSPSGTIVAQSTQLGWILSGDTSNTNPETNKQIISMHVCLCENNLLKKFWEIENEVFTSERKLTKDEQKCEDIYKKTTVRTESGRYKVHLPLVGDCDPVEMCGKTREMATSRFLQLERKFQRNNNLKQEYGKVINEYIELGHMTEVIKEEKEGIYLPHHAVLREDKDTTKIRVVFDASAKGSNGKSLNDIMLTGPVIQRDLRTLIMEWRTYKIALVSDIVKMYRQVLVTDEHTNYQRILWRESPHEDLKTYKILRVTFGTTAAPFLACRTLVQVADDEQQRFPRASEIVKTSFYMDDLMCGASTESEAIDIYNQVTSLLESAGFELQKWSSNSNAVLEKISGNRVNPQQFEIKFDKVIKILGLVWDRMDDKFKFHISLPDSDNPITKRSILSEVARLFDPFGWLAPVIVIAKVLIQKLWLGTCEWDDEIPVNLKEEWLTYRKQLHGLENIQIERWFHTYPNSKSIELHGFSDASTMAYGAVVYVKVISDDEVSIKILEAKTKVAPLKMISVPRLELCAAAMVARLLSEAREVLKVPKNKVYAYTDSMIVLAWLQSQPSRWQTFVANRVSEIQQRLDNDRWSHVTSEMNPADLASRGVNPSELEGNRLWWQGPQWLSERDLKLDKSHLPDTNLEEKKQRVQVLYCEEVEPIWHRFSSLTRMVRVLSYCRRFLHLKNKTKRIITEETTYLTTEEMNRTLDSCIKMVQTQHFSEEIQDLKQHKGIKKRSKLITLSPYLDTDGLLRVGGRIQASQLSLQYKHPIIIPKDDHLTTLIVRDAHYRLFHGSVTQMLNYLRSRYWIIGQKQLIKKCNRECVVCVKHRGDTLQPYMGQLPKVRVNPGRAFETSGVDFAGPIPMRVSKGRGQRTFKGYICLFVCMKTKAIHLEAVSDLTTQGFMAAFRRFVSRRGHCADLYSDNGLNFVGASRELPQMYKDSLKSVSKEVAELLSNDNTTWHFIPPRAPNFGGIWEAGIKSVKTHLVKTIGDSTLTFEEMSTLLTQIEACLNSRPLCALNDDPDDIAPLTPAHFLVGEPLVAIPAKSEVQDESISPLQRWRLIQKMMMQFWNRWSREFLHTMQQRYKWQKPTTSPDIGDIVVIKDELPPTKWLLARVVEKHVGPDGHVRVLSLKCKNSIIKRPLSKLIPLPYGGQTPEEQRVLGGQDVE